MNILVWVQTHWADVASIITSAIGLASIIVKVTPTLKDDTVLQKVVAFVGKYIALNKTINPADRPK
jgi:hypothetical protein